MLRAENVPELVQKLATYRQETGMNHELKWTKVNAGSQAEYTRLVVNGAKALQSGHLCFRSMVVPRMDIDYRTYHSGSTELGFYKLLYTFVLNCFGSRVVAGDRIIVKLDNRNTKAATLQELKLVLNNGARKKWGISPFVNVESVDSKKSDIMQFADVLMGAVGFHNNDRHLELGTRPSKVHVAAELAKAIGLTTLKTQTPASMKHFGVWQFRFRSKKRAS